MLRYLKKIYLEAGDTVVVTASYPCEARLVSDYILENTRWNDEVVYPHPWLPVHLHVRYSGKWNIILLTDVAEYKQMQLMHSVSVIKNND